MFVGRDANCTKWGVSETSSCAYPVVGVPGHEDSTDGLEATGTLLSIDVASFSPSSKSNSLSGRRRWGSGERSHDIFTDRPEAGETPAWSEGIRDEWLLSSVVTGDGEKRPGGSEKGLSDSFTSPLPVK